MRSGFRKYRFLALLAIPFFLLIAPPLAEGATIYVDAAAGGANNGTSWADAFTDLQAALAASDVGDDIWIAAGTYLPTAGADRTISFVLKNGVALYGGFAGTETAVEQRDWTVNVTILSGNIGDPGTNADNSYSVLNGSNRDSTAVLDGFYITRGNANGVLDELQRGGGMIVYNGSPTVRNCTFHQNNAADNGGGLYVNDSAPLVIHCMFSMNSAANGAGMTNINNGGPVVTDCVFSQNHATNVGGGMFNAYGGNPTVTNCTFSQNYASLGGGGMHSTENSHPIVTDSLFFSNNANHGAGMYNSNDSNPVITGSTFLDNTASIVGGGMDNFNGGDAVVTNCTFSGNGAAFSGGGMRNNNSNPVVTNSTFSGNSALNEGGGLYNAAGSSVVLMNCTFFENTALHGAGMFSDASNPVVTNTIFWSAGSTAGQIYNQNASAPVITYSITDQPGTGNIVGEPRLGPLEDNGGMTSTHALLDGSAALDAGTSAGAPAIDQRGVARPQGAGIDIGAFERIVAPGGSGGGGCGVGFSPGTLLLLLPFAFLMRR